MHIETVETGYLTEFFLLCVICPKISPLILIPIRKEIESCPMPHRLRVRGFIPGDIFGFESFEVKKPNSWVHSTAIPLPRAEIDRDGNVRKGLAVWRDRTEFSIRNRQLFRQATVG